MYRTVWIFEQLSVGKNLELDRSSYDIFYHNDRYYRVRHLTLPILKVG
jgi:hypothetical protein